MVVDICNKFRPIVCPYSAHSAANTFLLRLGATFSFPKLCSDHPCFEQCDTTWGDRLQFRKAGNLNNLYFHTLNVNL